MVRFQWHVEEDLGAYISPNRMQVVKETGVSHALCEIEVRFSCDKNKLSLQYPFHTAALFINTACRAVNMS